MCDLRHWLRMLTASRLVGLLLIMVAGVVLADCQSTMSVEEAKKVTVAFSGNRFVPPPRKITDITAILESQKSDNAGEVARARARVQEAPPPNADSQRLAAFYYERGLAMRMLGDSRREIEDLTRSLDLASSPFTLMQLARAESAGNLAGAIEHLRQLAQVGESPSRRGWLLNAHYLLSRIYALSGDLPAAEASLTIVKSVYGESSRWDISASERAGYAWQLASAQGLVLEGQGRLAEAEPSFRETIKFASASPTLSQDPRLQVLWGDLARLLARQGRLLEAENEVRGALLDALRKHGRNTIRTANVVRTLVSILGEQGRYSEAEALARAVLDIHAQIGSPPDAYELARARDELAITLVAQARWRDALEQYEKVRAALPKDSYAFQRYFAANVNWAIAQLGSGQPAEAVEMLRLALQRAPSLAENQAVAELHGLLGIAYAAQGDPVAAVSEFKDATNMLLNRSFAADDESTTRPLRDQRLSLILESYIGALATLRGTALERQLGLDAAAEAFRLADVARGRTVQRALDAAAARAVAQTPALADLVRREQDAKKQLSALYAALSNALDMPNNQESAKALDRLRGEIETLRRAHEALSREIETGFPTYGELINPKPATVDLIRARLRPGEAMIATLVTADRTFVWAVPQVGALAFAASPLGEKALSGAILKVRKSVNIAGIERMGEIPEFDLSTAHELYRQILKPVAHGWESASHLIIVGHGPLGHLPFGLLPREATRPGAEQAPLFSNYRSTPWLIRTHAVTVLPSASALATLRSLPAADPSRKPFVGFGDPYFSEKQASSAQTAGIPVRGTLTQSRPFAVRNVVVSPKDTVASSQLSQLPRLPDTADEIRSIAEAMKANFATDVFLGERANVQTVKSLDLTKYRVVVFATHGLVPGDLDGLTQPALALSAPEVAKIPGNGLLTMEDILALRLNADWVVLSACNTANGNGAGAEAISGLGRAFFYAGARAVLVTSWPVETTSARVLTTTLFKRLSDDPTLTRAKALQQTLNFLIEEGVLIDPDTKQAVLSYAHPVFWAPFSLVGDGG